jgi:hypothetical protein
MENIWFNPEIAWNYRLSFMQGFTFLAKVLWFFDFYRTDFQNQAVVDVLQSHNRFCL